MKAAGLVIVAVLATATACGSAAAPGTSGADVPSHSPILVACAGRVTHSVKADLVGDGAREEVDLVGPGGDHCPANLAPQLAGATDRLVEVDDLPLAPHGLRAVTIPGRKGQLVLLVQTQPRGGYQTHLFGYADGGFEELDAEGRPVFPFVSTDTGSSHLAAHCLDGGFDVETAQHSSKRTWNVARTVYQVSGNTVTAGATTVVAQDVSDLTFQQSYGDLAGDDLFTDC